MFGVKGQAVLRNELRVYTKLQINKRGNTGRPKTKTKEYRNKLLY